MVPDKNTPLANLLAELELALNEGGLWSSERPEPEAFLSLEPFSINTMSFWCWLQYVFIPRVRELLDACRPLPSGSCMYPMAAQVAQGDIHNRDEILVIIGKIDTYFNQFN